MSEVDPAPQPHRFHPELSSAPQDEANMRQKMSSWMRQSITINSASQCVQLYSRRCVIRRTVSAPAIKYSVGSQRGNTYEPAYIDPKAYASVFSASMRSDPLNFSISWRCSRASEGRAVPLACYELALAVKRIPLCYVRCFLSRMAATHPAILGLNYGQSEQVVDS